MSRALAVPAIGAVVAFLLLFGLVMSGVADQLDPATADMVYVPVDSGWRPLVEAFSRLGQGDTMTVVTLAAMIACAASRRWSLVLLWLLAVGGSGLLNGALKAAGGRARPRYADPRVVALDALSFPSGHVMMTLVLAGFALYLFVRRPRPAATRAVAIVVTLLWCGAMGLSRLLLGNHFATDVLGGYLAGFAWLAVCVMVAERVLPRPSTPM
jgi:undecaprenyl-diphosphatase